MQYFLSYLFLLVLLSFYFTTTTTITITTTHFYSSLSLSLFSPSLENLKASYKSKRIHIYFFSLF